MVCDVTVVNYIFFVRLVVVYLDAKFTGHVTSKFCVRRRIFTNVLCVGFEIFYSHTQNIGEYLDMGHIIKLTIGVQ